ncbi:hypothetical protein AVEN_219412-1, partial [Araneus ventricosus]
MKQPPDATSSSDSDPDFSPRPQTNGLKPSRGSIPRTLMSPLTMISNSIAMIGFDGQVLWSGGRVTHQDNAEYHLEKPSSTQKNLQALRRSVKYCAVSFDEHYSFKQFIQRMFGNSNKLL